MSKFIQLAVMPESATVHASLFALDEDGTVWVRPITNEEKPFVPIHHSSPEAIP